MSALPLTSLFLYCVYLYNIDAICSLVILSLGANTLLLYPLTIPLCAAQRTAVRWAAHNGIVSGYSSNVFAPNDNITREQMASILYRYTQYKNKDVSGRADISNYQDRNEISNYALTAMQWACDAGIINGISTTVLSPKGTTTRAQVAQMFKEYLEEQ